VMEVSARSWHGKDHPATWRPTMRAWQSSASPQSRARQCRLAGRSRQQLVQDQQGVGAPACCERRSPSPRLSRAGSSSARRVGLAIASLARLQPQSQRAIRRSITAPTVRPTASIAATFQSCAWQ
jgi:hypothetical protein